MCESTNAPLGRPLFHRNGRSHSTSWERKSNIPHLTQSSAPRIKSARDRLRLFATVPNEYPRSYWMSKVRVLAGTRKGAFILTADGKRQNWEVSGPHFPGWEMYH